VTEVLVRICFSEKINKSFPKFNFVPAIFRFLFPALGGLLFGYDIGATSGATISLQVHILFIDFFVIYLICF
jgi:hypothetical protein